MKYFVITVSALVLFAITIGFLMAGSPMRARYEKFDNIRVNNLQTTQNDIAEYYRVNGKLPQKLDELGNTGLYVMINDPETGKNFAYEATGTTTYKLCADFRFVQTESGGDYGYPVYAPNFISFGVHGTGHQCFDRSVNPAMYQPPIKQ
jgi:hypothetical protein